MITTTAPQKPSDTTTQECDVLGHRLFGAKAAVERGDALEALQHIDTAIAVLQQWPKGTK